MPPWPASPFPRATRFFIVPETGAGKEYPFSGEKLSVVMALYRVKDIDAAIALTNKIQAYQGQGHSCGIYSNNDINIMKLALATKTSRVMVNQPQAPSNSGNLWNGMRQTFSLGCGSWGGNSTNNNITWRDLINETWVSKPLGHDQGHSDGRSAVRRGHEAGHRSGTQREIPRITDSKTSQENSRTNECGYFFDCAAPAL